jgi:DNA-directed RNA polymerase subunit F
MDFDFIEDEEVRAKAIEAHKASMDQVMISIDEKIEEATSGLKQKNDELLNEKKQIQKTLKNFENIDPEKAREALNFLDNNDDAQMIKDGKIGELIDKRTSQMRSDHEAAILELSNNFEESKSTASQYKGLYESKMIDDAIREAAIGAKVRPEAITDILLRGRSVFSLNEKGDVESRTKDGHLRKTIDDKILTTVNWIEGLKKDAPHYWPGSDGVGANGGHLGDMSDIDRAINQASASGNQAEFRRLRDKKKKMQANKIN